MKRTMHRLRLIALIATLGPLNGCAAWHYYRPLPPGQEAELWHAEGIPTIDFDIQTAHRDDLIAGSGAGRVGARNAADAVDRMRSGHAIPLPASSISKVGQGGGGGGAGAGGP